MKYNRIYLRHPRYKQTAHLKSSEVIICLYKFRQNYLGTVTYYRNNPATTDKTTDKTYQGVKEVILRAMQSSPSITIEELSAICHLSQDGVRYHIKYLKSEGRIRRVGKKGNIGRF